MRVDDSIALLTTQTTARAQSLIQAWRVGQILEAVVERISNVGNATLNVNNQSVDVKTSQPLAVGDKLSLQVTQSDAQVILRILQAVPPRQPVVESLRSLLPKQGSLEKTLAQLAQIAPPLPAKTLLARIAALSGGHSPPNPILEMARKLIDRLPTPEQVQSPEQLREAIKNAGPFFERKLAGSALAREPDLSEGDFEADLKANLLKIAEALSRPPDKSAAASPNPTAAHPDVPVPGRSGQPIKPSTVSPEILPSQWLLLDEDVQSALARITVHQLASLPDDPGAPPQWLLDIPLRNGERFEVLHLHIFREPKPRDPSFPPAWCVRLTFDLVTLGPVAVLVTYHALAISVSVWATEPSTAALFENHLNTLKQQLIHDGIHLNHIRCECGKAPFAADPVQALKHHSLIDERI